MEKEKYQQSLLIIRDILAKKITTLPILSETVEKWNQKYNEDFFHTLAIYTLFENYHEYIPKSREWLFVHLQNLCEIIKNSSASLKDENLRREMTFYFIILCLLRFEENERMGKRFYRALQLQRAKDIYKMLELSNIPTKHNYSAFAKQSSLYKIENRWHNALKNWENRRYPSPPFISLAKVNNQDSNKDFFLVLSKIDLKLIMNPDSNFIHIQSPFVADRQSFKFSQGVLTLPLSNTKNIASYLQKIVGNLAPYSKLDILFYVTEKDGCEGLRRLLRNTGRIGVYVENNYQNTLEMLEYFYDSVASTLERQQARYLYQNRFRGRSRSDQIPLLSALDDWERNMSNVMEEIRAIPNFKNLSQYISGFHFILFRETLLLKIYQNFKFE